ncbi:MAG: DsbC family protein [Burkholderiaceae bacterium]|jgi:thiol:disulfide interchange protein DsbC|nr:DsbC family protein [Burkholderiaceae bacterium]
MTKNLKHVSIGLLILGMASSVFALNEKQIRTEIQKRLGTSANVRNVTPSPIPGLFEVQVNNEIFYTDSNAKYLIQGEMVELASGNNLTTKRQEDINRIKWSELPQVQAFKVVRGNGSRQIAVFSDPNCGYCKRLEKTLQQLDNVTIYNYLIPILSADSALKSKQIWCAADQQKVWNDWMLNNLGPSGKSDCANPIDKNLTLAKNYGINGTPTIFFTDGSRFPGAVQLADIEKKLASLK